MPSFQLVVKFVMLTLGYLQDNSQGTSLTEHQGHCWEAPVLNQRLGSALLLHMCSYEPHISCSFEPEQTQTVAQKITTFRGTDSEMLANYNTFTNHFVSFAYSISCRELDELIDTTLMSVR